MTTEELSQKIAQHVLSGNCKPFVSKRTAQGQDASLTLSDAELGEVNQAVDRFCEKQLPAMLPVVGGRISKTMLKNLKARWADKQVQQDIDLSEFRGRMEGRWGKPLGQLRMLLTMVREWCESAHRRESSRKTIRKSN